MFSGGGASWATARRVIERGYVPTLLFADTLIEDEDLYRFLDDAAEDLGVPVTRVADGRDPWQVFFDRRFLGNTRVDLCSRILKRELLRDWLDRECDPPATVVYLGFDGDEGSRMDRARGYWTPWAVKAPLLEDPPMDKDDVRDLMHMIGLREPRLYGLGFKHNNCGGFCVKAGHEQFLLLLKHFPERFDAHAKREQELRAHLGKDIAILRDRRGGKLKPLTLVEFKRRALENEQLDCFGGSDCSCFSPGDA